MFHKIKEIKPLKRYVLLAIFQDGTVKMYDVGHLFDEIEIFNALKEIPCLFERVKDDLANSIVLFGSSPYNTELAKASFELAYEYFQKCLDIRRSGSAALDLCAIASGRAEIYFELILSPWDFAAGALIVEEAGGVVTTVEGGELPCLEKSSLLARNL